MKTEKQQSEVKSKLDRGFEMDHLATKFFAENSLGQNKLSSKYYFHRKFFRPKGFSTKEIFDGKFRFDAKLTMDFNKINFIIGSVFEMHIKVN